MGLFSKLFRGGKSDADFTGSFETFLRMTGMRKGRESDVFDDLSDEQLLGVYKTSAIVRRCVWELAETAALPPLQIGQFTGDGEGESFEANPVHPLKPVLERPTPQMDYGTFMQLFVSRLMLCGYSPVRKIRPKTANELTGNVMGLFPWLPTNFRLRLQKGWEPIAGFATRVNTSDTWQNEDYGDWIYAYYPDPASQYKACGPLQAAQYDHQMDVERLNFTGEILENLDVPGLVVTSEGMGDAEYERFRAQMKDRAGKGKRGSTALIDGMNAKAALMNPLQDVDLPGLSSMSESRICMAFGVPPILIGTRLGLERSTFSNYEEARKSFYENTMIPFWHRLESLFTHTLLREEGDTQHVVKFDTSEIPELQPALEELSARARKDYESGVITREEARKEAGYPAEPEGETWYKEGENESSEFINR